MGKCGKQMRSSKELEKVINYIKARSLLEGMKIPSTNDITKKIAEMIDKEKLWYEHVKQ